MSIALIYLYFIHFFSFNRNQTIKNMMCLLLFKLFERIAPDAREMQKSRYYYLFLISFDFANYMKIFLTLAGVSRELFSPLCPHKEKTSTPSTSSHSRRHSRQSMSPKEKSTMENVVGQRVVNPQPSEWGGCFPKQRRVLSPTLAN